MYDVCAGLHEEISGIRLLGDIGSVLEAFYTSLDLQKVSHNPERFKLPSNPGIAFEFRVDK